MSTSISEQALETAIVADLVKGHYVQRQPSAFDKALCLDPGPLIDFVQATQAKEWERFRQQHKDEARTAFLKRVAQAVAADRVVTVLRQGVKATGCKFRLTFWRPETSLNPDTETLYQANQFTVMRQVRYSERTDHRLDVVLSLNGMPLFTAELKNPFNGQDVTDAITQYRRTLDPREPLFVLGRRVAFSGTVTDDDTKQDFTETGMNGFPETQTAAKFATDPYRLLIVANKFQTGFDQPLLHTMYVDKKLAGVNAVQTLSRLNPTLPPLKSDTCVLDFADNAERVKEAFGRYYGQTTVAELTDPNDLYAIESALKKYEFYFPADVEAFAAAYFKPRAVMEKVYAALKPVVDRVAEGEEADQREFGGTLNRYAELYAFLGQVTPFADADLEQLYQFCPCLLRLLPVPREDQPRELQKFVDVNTVRLVQAAREAIALESGKGVLEPHKGGVGDGKPEEQLEPLSEILKLLNERFGTNFTEEDKLLLETLEEKLDMDAGMAASFAVDTRENARLTFDLKVRDHVQDMIDTNFKFFKQINDKPEFADFLNDLLFDRYAERKTQDVEEDKPAGVE